MTRIEGSAIVITGGASGIGRLMALGFAARGASVAVLDRDGDGAQRVAEEMTAATGRDHLGIEVDITDRARVTTAAAEVAATIGPADVLVNNAGVINGGTPLLDTPDEQIQQIFAVNSLALFWVTKAFLPSMVERDRGHVVTIGSASGMVGVSRLVAYASSKHAAIGFDESLRMELAALAPGVRTTIVNPYYIDTGMFGGVHTKVPWLLPILREHQVAERIIEAVARDRRRVTMPWAVRLLPPMHVLPVTVFDWVIDRLGVNDTMRTFHGRGPAHDERAATSAGDVGRSLTRDAGR